MLVWYPLGPPPVYKDPRFVRIRTISGRTEIFMKTYKHLFFRSDRIRRKVEINYRYKFMIFDYTLCLETPGIITQFSKYDFWNLGDFGDRNMWSKMFSSKKFWSEIFSIEKIFFRKLFVSRPKKILRKSQWKMKILKFQKMIEIFRPKIFDIFSIIFFCSNIFENQISPWKNNIFVSVFFSDKVHSRATLCPKENR